MGADPGASVKPRLQKALEEISILDCCPGTTTVIGGRIGRTAGSRSGRGPPAKADAGDISAGKASTEAGRRHHGDSENRTAMRRPGAGLNRRAFGGLTLATLAGAQLAAGPAAAAGEAARTEDAVRFAGRHAVERHGPALRQTARGGHRRPRQGAVLSAELGDAVQGLAAGRPAPACSTSASSGIRFCPASSRRWSCSRLPGLSKNQSLASIVYWRLRDEFPADGQAVHRRGQRRRPGDLRRDGFASAQPRADPDPGRPQGQGLRRAGLCPGSECWRSLAPAPA